MLSVLVVPNHPSETYFHVYLQDEDDEGKERTWPAQEINLLKVIFIENDSAHTDESGIMYRVNT